MHQRVLLALAVLASFGICLSQAQNQRGSCLAHGITQCCRQNNCPTQRSPDGCFCDTECGQFGDCCADINQLCGSSSSSGCTNGTVRLVGGANDQEGRVEVCINGTWGTVCDDFWSNRDARVVCSQLGYNNSGAVGLRRAHFGPGTGPIHLDNVNCTGSESSLFSCSYNQRHDCNHLNDASVLCGGSQCVNGSVRLVGGTSNSNGRVEVCTFGVWGTVCDDDWDVRDATVICRQLNFTVSRVLAVNGGRFPAGTGAINMDDVECVGNENSVFDCKWNENSNCGHAEDAGVFCGVTLGCTDGEVRLVGGNTRSEGRVEVCVSGQWGSVCNDQWDDYAAKTVCRELGYPIAGSVGLRQSPFGNSTGPVFLGGVRCTGHERSLLACQHTLRPQSCGNSLSVGVRCQPGPGECTDGSIRLVGSGSSNEGRVEVCVFERWGTVCDRGWGIPHAEVACGQLGLPRRGARVLRGAFFGPGTGPINMDSVMCGGNEASLFNCTFSSNENTSCFHLNDVSVRCPCATGDVRLAGSNSSREGRVEVCINGVWGTVTDDLWGRSDALVVCRQLGFNEGIVLPFYFAYFGQGTGPIHLDNVQCNGSEPNLLACPHNRNPFFNSHFEDAGVRCLQAITSPCRNGDVRLRGSFTNRQGRVEVCVNGVWGTVCDDFWDSREARIVCRQLGFADVAQARSRASFGRGTGLIHLDDMQCTGTESSLLQCETFDANTRDCSHFEDAGVICYTGDSCSHGAIRLVGGSRSSEGRVEVCVRGVWGTVTDDLWDTNDARVVCRQLGYFDLVALPLLAAFFGRGTAPILMDNVRCTGNEQSLVNCTFSTLTQFDSHFEDASVRCYERQVPGASCQTGDIRLVGGPNNLEGRVEICLGGTWGTVCDDFWSSVDANVLCRQLNHSGNGAAARNQAFYGPGIGPIFLDDVRCGGFENSLFRCPFDANTRDCSHSEDAGVKCQPRQCTDGEVRLSHGSTPLDGRVEVCVGGSWGTVCDDFWDTAEARVVCRQLGHSDIFALAYNSAFHGQDSTLPIVMDNLFCIGNESGLLDCPFDPHTADCSHTEDSGVRCYPQGSFMNASALCQLGEVRLVGGNSPSEGRVEICFNNEWGTVCDDRFEDVDAGVVCKQLNFSSIGGRAIPRAPFGPGTGPILMDNVFCTGNEAGLVDCLFDPHTADCSHSKDVGIQCYIPGNCTAGDLRLVNGSVSSEGRVEVCIDGVWGTVTDDFFDNTDARVICRQLGFNDQFGIAYPNAFFGQGTGPIVLDNLLCIGNEERLLDCRHSNDTVVFDIHAEDAGVRCFANTTDGACVSGSVRLAGGNVSSEGRVEVCISGIWGTVCDFGWNQPDARVVCGQLGYSNQVAQIYRGGTKFAPGNSSAPIYISSLICNGRESHILQCRFTPIPFSFCTHARDAGVACFRPGQCTNGALRLRGSSTSNEGRLELCRQGVWGSVCGNIWSISNTQVACRQLGFSDLFVSQASITRFGVGNGPVHIASVSCSGSESQLTGCRSSTFTDFCRRTQDVAISCFNQSQCTNNAIRLGNATNNNRAGRVEYCQAGVWGTVCDDRWGTPDATVACRQLGLSTQFVIPYASAYFGQGSGNTVFNNLNCIGFERTLGSCRSFSFRQSCPHTEDAGVACLSAAQCTTGAVRLANGNKPSEGRVEVCVGGIWGTVTDDLWDVNDARVVCRQLGYKDRFATAFRFARFGQGNGRINLDNVRCTGSEPTLLSCRFSTPINDFHFEDAGVRCFNQSECDHGDIRLAGRNTSTEGRIEVCIDGVWGTVTDDLWGTNDARVACRQLGFNSDVAIAFGFGFFGRGEGPIHLDNVACTGNEERLINCSFSSSDIFDSHFEDAGVRCFNLSGTDCTNGDVRLVAGANDMEGRVEVCFGGTWGTVCDDFWSVQEADVVCRQLNFSGSGNVPKFAAFFGQGNGTIWMDDVRCTGSESKLTECPFDSVTTDCTHTEDAGVRCLPRSCTDGDIRLLGGSNALEGRVEICHDGGWGTVCANFWSSANARVVCRAVGHSDVFAIPYSNAHYGPGSGPIVLNNVRCNGTEPGLHSCSFSTSNTFLCNHNRDAGVRCFSANDTGVCSLGDVRLVGGQTPTEGRVEVCIGGVWGTVCNDFWSALDADVACGQAGFAKLGVTISARSGSGPIHLDDLRCTGRESKLVHCPLDLNTQDCTHSKDAGVRCYTTNNCTHGDIRLAGSSIRRAGEGRVEVCLNGVWGTVTDDGWNSADARVVCRQLGFSAGGATALSNAAFGPGFGLPILMDNTFCRGQEQRLVDCTFNRDSTRFDNHFEDASVRCRVPDNCTHGDLRLVGGSSPLEGRVEVCVDRVWGTVTDDSWNTPDAIVVCRQLGYAPFGTAFLRARFGRGTVPIVMDNVFCRGSEQSLVNCSYRSPDQFDSHFEDAGVRCFNSSGCDHGTIRLAGGSNSREGRVEVCYFGIWGTVTDDSWDLNEAQVVCRQLNFSTLGATPFGLATFGRGTGPIVMTNLGCRGTEGFLVNCSFSTNTQFDTHAEDAGVRCVTNPCNHGDIRLVGGSGDHEGRVEVCLRGVWGTVTDDLWDNTDARVVCRQLGFGTTGARAFSFAFFGAGSGPILLDNVRCTGREATLISCTYSTPFFDNHFEDAGVRCTPPPANCSNGDIRLVGGQRSSEGRIEMCQNRAWGTITDDGWGVVDARVACRELGFSTIGVIARTNAFFGRGTGSILRDNVNCRGTERRLRDCRFTSPDRFDSHFEDAGVQCTVRDNCTHGSIRLVNGNVPTEGRVEVCVQGIWGTVTDDFWDARDARVVCRQLGYSDRYAVPVLNARFGPNNALPILLDNVFCTGSEQILVNCTYSTNTVFDTHNEDAGVQCFRENVGGCRLGDVRLVGGANSTEGRVEVCANGAWSTICDDFWDNNEAIVVCRQLGFSHIGATAFSRARFGQGSGTILLDDMRCSGRESNILDCPHDPNTRDCSHSEDAGVRCIAGGECTNNQIRLIGGDGDFEGRVEVCVGGVWGTVCHDFWDSNDATVACRQLGLPTQFVIPFRNAYFGQGNSPIAIDDLRCRGSELSLLNCSYDANTADCRHIHDAGVACLNTSLCNDGEVRLVNGTATANVSSGRVEYCRGGVWGTVCDDLWDVNEARVVCRQLGLSTSYATSHDRAYFGQGRGPIFLDDLRCTGREPNISSCRADLNTFDCSHREDAGVTCRAQPECSPDWSIRLADGNNSAEGRVEVCLDGLWGTVADDFWDVRDGRVVCKQLGFHPFAVSIFRSAFFGQGTGPIHLDNVQCSGREANLRNCFFSRDAREDFHFEDAGVRCAVGGECTTGEIRLVNGGVPSEGRVEVCVSGIWGSVADDFWGSPDAQVVCGQLGYSREVAFAYSFSRFGQATVPILMDNVNCRGNETLLVNCTFDPDASEDFHFEDAGVKCFNESINSVCQLGAIRLAGSSIPLRGRVEVCVNNRWGTVCDDRWNAADANVVCGQLGHASRGAQAVSFAAFGQGSGPIHLDDVLCTGNEDSLFDCIFDPVTTDCRHSEDAGVRCQARICNEGDLRLRGGSTSSEGRVEICRQGRWGTVCDDQWDSRDARVVCRQLGFSDAVGLPFQRAFFGRGSGPILFDDSRCVGTESRLLDCPFDPLTGDCFHGEDAGVRCFNASTGNCTLGDIRLVGGSNAMEGRVEVCLGGEWGTVCDDVWGTPDATVVCRQLGFNTSTAFAFKGAFYGQGDGSILLDDVTCGGGESSLIQCRADGHTQDCRHRDDASVRCSPASDCNHGDIRLASGNSNSEGRVEVCVNGLWGTVAHDLWSSPDARVVCRQLGYSEDVAFPYRGPTFGPGTGLIHFDNVRCSGSERRLVDCPLSNDTSEDVHRKDAGVRCFSRTVPGGVCTTGSIRLVGGTTPYQGRVEVCVNGTWGTVTDDFWNDRDARVVCRQMNFSTAGSIARYRAFYGRGTGPILLDNLFCNGNEENLFHCPFSINTATDTHAEDAGVQCYPKVVCYENDIRLVGGTSPQEGRVEVCYGGAWGTVTDFGFNVADARVVCRQLGYDDNSPIIRRNAFYGQGVGLPITFDTLGCRGDELYLVNCTFNLDTDNHNHRDDVGVSCSSGPAPPTSAVAVSTSVVPEVSSTPPVVLPVASSTPPPPVASSTPPPPVAIPTPSPPPVVNSETARRESVGAILGGFTSQTFTVELQNTFRDVTASVVNSYCQRNAENCNFASRRRDIGSRAVMVERSDVVITDTRDTDEGNLRVSFYVKQGSKVLRGDALANAVQAGSDAYTRSGFSMISVAPVSGTIQDGSPVPVVAIVVVVVVVLVVIAIVVAVLAIFWMRKRTMKASGNMGIGLVTSPSTLTDISTDNPMFSNDNVPDDSKLRFEHLEEEEEEEDIVKDSGEL